MGCKTIYLCTDRSGSELLYSALESHPDLDLYRLHKETPIKEFLIEKFSGDSNTVIRLKDFLFKKAEGFLKEDYKFIYLRRMNLLAQCASLNLASNGQRFGFDEGPEYLEKSIGIDPKKVKLYFKVMSEIYQSFEDYLKGKNYIRVTYEELSKNLNKTVQGIFRFLELPETEEIKPQKEKQNKLGLPKYISNYEELKEYFSGTVWEKYIIY